MQRRAFLNAAESISAAVAPLASAVYRLLREPWPKEIGQFKLDAEGYPTDLRCCDACGGTMLDDMIDLGGQIDAPKEWRKFYSLADGTVVCCRCFKGATK